MSFANIFLGLRHPEADNVIERLNWDEEADGRYTGSINDRAHRIFKFMAAQGQVSRMFKRQTLGANEWSLWTISFNLPGSTLAKIKAELDWLIGLYGSNPVRVSIAGAWKWDGSQFGTEHVYSTRTVNRNVRQKNPDYQPDDQLPNYNPQQFIFVNMDVEGSYVSGFTGTPIYPVPLAALLKFMPDRRDADGNVLGSATQLTQVNKLMGQGDRYFG